jgi:hypothetical protein
METREMQMGVGKAGGVGRHLVGSDGDEACAGAAFPYADTTVMCNPHADTALKKVRMNLSPGVAGDQAKRCVPAVSE